MITSRSNNRAMTRGLMNAVFFASAIRCATSATSDSNADCPIPSLTPDQFSKLELDYIVIGSGAGGLPLAARLSENSNVKVGLIEAGVFHLNDPTVDIPLNIGLDVGNASYDWLFESVPQSHAAGQVITEPRGKMLGGSTGLNFMGWDRASAPEYDSWGTFLAPNVPAKWDFDNFLPYLQKVESLNSDHFDQLPGVTKTGYASAKSAYGSEDGSSGPISVEYNNVYGDLVGPYTTSLNRLGVPTNPNIYGGDTSGVRNERRSTKNSLRSYAATAYYCPAAKRGNLHVITQAQVTKVNFAKGTQNGLLKASGVSFVSVNPSSSNSTTKTFTVNAAKEVILSAGSVQTPQLLELSGIGDKAILSKLGIRTLKHLPGVGANLQDHIFVVSQFVALRNISTFDQLRYNETFLEEQMAIFEQNRTGFVSASDSTLAFVQADSPLWNSTTISSLTSSLQAVLSSGLSPSTQTALTPLQKKQYQTQLGWMSKGSKVPEVEIIGHSAGEANLMNDTNYMSLLVGLLHPMARGSIHVSSTDPLAHPVIDPQYLSFDYDLQTLRMSVEAVRKIAAQEPLSGLLTQQQLPLANMTAVSDLEGYVKSSIISGAHLSGTAAMASESLRGVVDSTLKVYGTSNLRVVDASVMPIQPGCHLQHTIYAISEKASDIIKSGL